MKLINTPITSRIYLFSFFFLARICKLSPICLSTCSFLVPVHKYIHTSVHITPVHTQRHVYTYNPTPHAQVHSHAMGACTPHACALKSTCTHRHTSDSVEQGAW